MIREKNTKLFGLLGRNIDYSFSRSYFSKKFEQLQLIDYAYVNFDIDQINHFPQILDSHPNLKGMNVTIPYKEQIIPFLDSLDEAAKEIGAVNTIQITKNRQLKGYNTDVLGFEKSLQKLLKEHHKKALVLGTGGASKAIVYALKRMGISSTIVSRKPNQDNHVAYQSIHQSLIEENTIIVNCTPLGTQPDIEKSPQIPYQFITKHHLLYDLIYNPEETLFLQKGKKQGANIKNGLEMLQVQAEEAWKIWNE